MRYGRIAASVAAALVIAGAALGVGAAGSRFDAVCQLRTADRAHTPAGRCLACHDGAIAHAVGFLSFPRDANVTPYQTPHSIGVSYAASAAQPGKRLVPPAALPKEIVLVGGRVSCTTCHDGASRQPAHTALPMRRSALCFACHDL